MTARMMEAAAGDEGAAERRRALLLFAAVLLVYGYFFQGYGYNQNAHFDTVRALVERGTFEITAYASDPQSVGFTGDVARVGARLYSSKPPGLPLVCVPFYATIYVFQHIIGLDPVRAEMVPINQHLCTIWGSALPGAILAGALYGYFRRRGLPPHSALLLAGGFAFGSLLFPYAGMLVAAPLMACCLFVAWRLVEQRPTRLKRMAAGGLVALAILAELSAAPVLLAYAVAVGLKRRRDAIWLLPGVIAGAVILLAYQRAAFGAALASPYMKIDDIFLRDDLLLGRFGLPDARLVYWLSIHPVRGLLYCCPIFVIPLLSLLARFMRPPSHPHTSETECCSWIIPAAVIVNFVAFNMLTAAWTAGWGVGPRYLVPALPFMMIFAVAGYGRFPRLSVVLIAISVMAMFTVAAVRAQWPATLYGPPRGDDPVADSLVLLIRGLIARDKGSTNIGLLLGLPGAWSLVPPIMVIVAVGVTITWLRRREHREHRGSRGDSR